MGVTYKLKEEILHFIIQRKQENAKVSCQVISDEIRDKFSAKVSKSSVHEALKNAGIISPRGRKPKDTFELPKQVKDKIQQEILNVPGNLIPPPEHGLSLIADIVSPDIAQESKENPISLPQETNNAAAELETAKDETASKASVRSQNYSHAGEIVLTAILTEMGIRTREEFEKAIKDSFYTFLVGAYKLVFADKQEFYLCPQFSDIANDFEALKFTPRFLPRATNECCDRLVNNIKPLIINDLQNNDYYDRLEKVFSEPGQLKKVSIMDTQGREIAAFDDCLAIKRHILKAKHAFPPVDFKKIDNINTNTLESISYGVFDHNISEQEFINFITFDGFSIKTDDDESITIIAPNGYNNFDNVQHLCRQLTGLRLCNDKGQDLTIKMAFLQEV